MKARTILRTILALALPLCATVSGCQSAEEGVRQLRRETRTSVRRASSKAREARQRGVDRARRARRSAADRLRGEE